MRLFVPDENGEPVPFEWGKGWQFQEYSWGRRLICSTDADRIDFLLSLVATYPGPFWIKFILEDNSGIADFRPGRYTSRTDLTLTQVEYFLREFSGHLQTDGRHLLMVCSDLRTVVFDQHDYFYVYGDLEPLLERLQTERHAQRSYGLGKHMHMMCEEVEPLRRLLTYWRWSWSMLEATDTSMERVGPFRWVRMKLRAWRFDWKARLRKGRG